MRRTRAWRIVLLLVLIASGAGAVLSAWNASRQIAELDRSQRELSDSVDRLLETLDAVGTAQQARGASFDDDPGNAARLIDHIRVEVESLRPHVRSIEGGRVLQSVATSIGTLRDIDARAQEHLRLGQDLMAADLLSSDGRTADEAIASGLRTIRASEHDAFATARAEALDSFWTIGGAVAAFWVVGLILLTRQPRVVVQEDPASTALAQHTLLGPEDSGQDSEQAPHLDLQAAADVCTAIGQMTRADDLPRLLKQAATVLEASGVVVWMAAGEELFAAAAFGYPAHVSQKLGPINRAAVNATAAAWRSGTLQTVSGRGAERSALAAPLLGPERCVGVLAVEVGVGQEEQAVTRAVTNLIAAQLAAALAGWPAASAAAPVQAPPLDRAAEA
jgi:hypothetical protein